MRVQFGMRWRGVFFCHAGSLCCSQYEPFVAMSEHPVLLQMRDALGICYFVSLKLPQFWQ